VEENRENKDNKLFNRIAAKYGRKDQVVSSSLARKFQLESVLDFISKEFQKSFFDTVLEIGCGVGASSLYMEGKFNQYIGIDYSKEFIELANQRYAKENVKYLCSNIKELNADKNPDLVLGIGVLHHITDINKAICEMKKISNKETIFAFIEPNSENKIIQLLRKIRMIVDKNYSEDQIYFSKQELENLFTINGFNLIKTKFQGYFSPPFAQVIINPQVIFTRFSKLSILLDKTLQRNFNNSLSWNMMVVARIC